MKKTLLTILCTVLVCSCVMGVTLAFLMDETDPITNTFTIGNIDIELTETCEKEFKLTPGSTYAKDPTITVKAGSEACYLFVVVDKSENFDTYITAEVDTSEGAWKALGSTPGVYYREVAAVSADTPIYVLKGSAQNLHGEVTVKSAITQADINALNKVNPTITFTAYAVQKDNLDVDQAWDEAKTAYNP